VSVDLKNVGEKPFAAEEYCHNFLTACGMAVGPGYRLEIPLAAGKCAGADENAIKGTDYGFTFGAYDPKPSMVQIKGLAPFEAKGAFEWRLRNADAKVSIRSEDSIRFSRAALWAADHMVSLEVFHKISLEPGESDSWTRTMVFCDDSRP
jgi:hypothetical protein